MQEQAWTRRRLIGHSRPTYDDFHESSYSSGSREAAGAWYLAVLQPAATAERSEAIATRTNSFLLLCHKIRCSHFLSLYIHKKRITGDGGPKMNSISLFFFPQKAKNDLVFTMHQKCTVKPKFTSPVTVYWKKTFWLHQKYTECVSVDRQTEPLSSEHKTMSCTYLPMRCTSDHRPMVLTSVSRRGGELTKMWGTSMLQNRP